MSIFKQRINKLQKKLEKINVDVAIITNEDNVYYLTGYYDYLHMEFGRPTIIIISINEGKEEFIVSVFSTLIGFSVINPKHKNDIAIL